MTALSELEVIESLKELMKDERIRPEPEFQSFSRYLVSLSEEQFLNNEQIFLLIDSHGVQLRNDIKFWQDRNHIENRLEDPEKPVPVLSLKDTNFSGFDDVLEKIKELPSEWTVVQITKRFSLADILRNESNQKLGGIYLTRLACGDLAEKVPPYSISVLESKNCQENIFKVLQNLVAMRREYFTLGRTNKSLREAYQKTNSDLMDFIKELEAYLLNEWICLFHGRLEDATLEAEINTKVKKLILSFCEKVEMKLKPSEKQLNIIYLMTLSAHFMKNKTMFMVLKSVLYCDDSDPVNISELKLLVEDIKMLNLSNDCAAKRARHNPLILIVDNEFESCPWEMITPLSGQPVCRVSSLHLLYAMYKHHQPYITNGFRTVKIDSTYCLINPSKDLKACETQMKTFLQSRLPWSEVDIGQAPEPKVLISKLKTSTIYLYCGHGTGMQYLEEKELKRSVVSALMLLFGCSSNIPKKPGGRTPPQNNTYTYILNGCPCTIGCIQDVSSTEADAACMEMLSSFMPAVVVTGEEKVVKDPTEPNVLRALAVGRSVCTKYWSKCSLVARGIPCKTVVGDTDKLTLVKFF